MDVKHYSLLYSNPWNEVGGEGRGGAESWFNDR